MTNYELEINRAKQLHLLNKIDEAQKIYLNLIKKDEKNNIIYFLLGTTYLQQKKFPEAIKHLKKSIQLNSNYSFSYNNLGIALAETNSFIEAKNNYDKAIQLNKGYLDAYLNRGISLNKLKKYSEAIIDFNLVIKANPYSSKAFNNIANVYKNLRLYDEAIKNYDKAIKIQPDYLEAINNKSQILYKQKKYELSLNCLNEIYKIDPEFDDLTENIIGNKMKIFDWSNLNKFKDEVEKKIIKRKTKFSPLFVNFLFDDPSLQQINAKTFCKQEFKYLEKHNSINLNAKNKKIKIGYFSANYHNHPVMHIMRNIFKHHDSKIFELYAFSLGPNKKKSILRNDVKVYFKEFFSVSNLNDEEIIRLANKLKIDIAVDLTGMTEDARPTLFFKRVAPIQLAYLGYPGTSGNEEIDYIIADENVIPKNMKKFYIEKVLYLPEPYISTPNQISLKERKENFKKKDFLLPENKIIFCAFHNPLKINPKLFHSWCNILNEVKNSVIWLKAFDDISKKNLKKEFNLKKIDLNRIIFDVGAEDINDHINRLKLADIFLDSFPYCSQSTTYDYIKANLPMVIMKGASFSSRVSASIYKSIKMDELISENYQEYEEIAIKLGNNKLKLETVKKKLKLNSHKFEIFENKKITKNLEKIYCKLLENYNL